MNKKLLLFSLLLFLMSILAISSFAATVTTASTVCCERTKSGAWCQNTLQSECDSAYSQTPSSCDSTSFCKLGTCYDSSEGLCLEKTSQKSCTEGGGVWNDAINPDDVPQCTSGCCVLGDQAAFTTLTRCKKLSSFYGLQNDFRKNIASEAECVAITQASDEGACVFDSDFIRTCRFTSRSDCSKVKDSNFYKDFLCSAEDLATNCGPTTKTTCLSNKDEVHFVDSCGNPANIYDSTKINDKAYWRKIIPKEESCNPSDSKGNANSLSCGNCQYFAGSVCKDYKSSTSSVKPSYGDFICQDLNCKDTYDGKDYRHGESWCANDGGVANPDSVGSRYYRHVCVAGEEIVEPCADFRQEVCLQGAIDTASGPFSQAGCVVNRWQDCSAQKSKDSCENSDRRDCKWSSVGEGVCFPANSPGLNFWSDAATSNNVCKQASEVCVVEFEKSVLGGEQCVKNCECLDPSWNKQKEQMCTSLGDCGTKVNVIKVYGSAKGWTATKPAKAATTTK